MSRKENNLANGTFYKLQHLKAIIQLSLLVIDGISDWLVFARCVLRSSAAAAPSAFMVNWSRTCPVSDSGLILFFNSLQIRLHDMITACRR